MKGRLAALGALALVCALQLVAVLRAPPAHHPARISVTLAAGGSIELGRHELAAPQAALRQLALRRASDGSWWVRNLQPARALLVDSDIESAPGAGRTGHTTLRAGQRLQIGPARFDVEAADKGALTLRGAGARWHYDGARLWRDGALQVPCPYTAPAARLQAGWNRWAPRWAAFERPLAFGGNLHCGNRIGIGYTEPGAALVQDMRLSSSIPILVDGIDPDSAEIPLAGVRAIGIGRTRLALQTSTRQPGQLHLLPQRDVAFFAERDATPAPGVAWHWTERDPWHLPGQPVPAALLTLACAALVAARRHPGALPAAIALAGAGALALQRLGAPPGIGCSLLLGWAALWCFALPRRLSLAGAAALVLLSVGMLVQLEVALGAPSSNWARYFQKTCALLALGLGAGSMLRLGATPMPTPRQVESLLGACALAALSGLALQVVVGDETGVFDLQPVEFAKLALTAVAAHCIAVGLGWHAGVPSSGYAWRALRLGAPVLLLGALSALALVQVNDFSPLLLLLVWCAGMALAWSTVTGRVGLAAAIVAACLLAGAAVAALHGADAGAPAQGGFYGDRFDVWRDPASHPHTGQQMLLAGRAIADGGWWGADGWLGLSSLGQGAGGVLAIPAVQDDFAPAFFLHRHGLAAALALWLLQALFLAGLLQGAARAHARAGAARDFRLAWRGRFACFALVGGAAVVAGHLLLSWGTNLAILPIMGQPMSFLSAGGSHLLLFICPLLTLEAMCGQSIARVHPTSSTSAAACRPHRRADHAGLCTT